MSGYFGTASANRSGLVPLIGGLALLAAVPAGARAQTGMAAMRTAERHAARAAQAHDLADIRTQLQQVLNCLEGPHGADYRASAGDPCKRTSALAGLPARSANHVRVEKAIRLAAVGVTFHDEKPARLTAEAVQAVLAEGTR